MAIVINTAPTNNASLSNEMLFVVYESVKSEDDVTYPNYQYVCDVYVDDVFKARIKARPDPVNQRGVFNISPILRDSASYGLVANYANATESYNIKVNYKVKFGEEYADTLYTNLLVDSVSREAYESYARRPFDSPDVLDDVVGSWATNIPRTIYNFKSQKWQLLPFYDNVSGIANFEAIFYNTAWVQVGATVSISAAGYIAKNVLQINAGFQKLSALLSTEQKEEVDYCQVAKVSAPLSEIITIRYACSKHTPLTLAWLNQFGGYDSYQFGMVSKKSIELSRKDFSKLNYSMNASGDVSYSSDGVFYGSKKGFASDVMVKMKLTSHLLNSDEYAWLADMFISPDVYIYDTVLEKFIPVTITENNYEYRTYPNSKLTVLDFNVQFSDNYNSQFL